MDRVMSGGIPKWLKCDSCGRTTDSDCDKQIAIDNWNKDKITYTDLL